MRFAADADFEIVAVAADAADAAVDEVEGETLTIAVCVGSYWDRLASSPSYLHS